MLFLILHMHGVKPLTIVQSWRNIWPNNPLLTEVHNNCSEHKADVKAVISTIEPRLIDSEITTDDFLKWINETI